MNRHLLLKLSFLLIPYILVGCGKQSVGGDKHPDIPLFPDHTNKNIEIKRFLNLYEMGSTDKYFYGYKADDYRYESSELYIYDRKFDYVSKVIDGISYISDDGFVFSRKLDDIHVTNVYQHKAPLFKRQELELIDVSGLFVSRTKDQIIQANQVEIKQRSSDPEFNKSKFINNIYSEEIRKRNKRVSQKINELSKNLRCSIKINYSVYIFTYKDQRNIAVDSFGWDEHPEITNNRCSSSKNLSDDLTEPDSFDKTVMGNSWSGNHFFGGYNSYGFNYINLEHGNEIIKSKVKNSNDNSGLYILIKSADRLILKKDDELFTVIKK